MYHFRYANTEDIPALLQIDQSVYQEEDTVSLDCLVNWYNHDPSCFYVLCKNNSEIIGGFSILHLTQNMMEQLLLGRIQEADIQNVHLSEKYGTNVYIPSINKKPSCTEREGYKLIRHLHQTLQSIQQTFRPVSCYAKPVTKEGLRICRLFNFEPSEENAYFYVFSRKE